MPGLGASYYVHAYLYTAAEPLHLMKVVFPLDDGATPLHSMKLTCGATPLHFTKLPPPLHSKLVTLVDNGATPMKLSRLSTR